MHVKLCVCACVCMHMSMSGGDGDLHALRALLHVPTHVGGVRGNESFIHTKGCPRKSVSCLL